MNKTKEQLAEEYAEKYHIQTMSYYDTQSDLELAFEAGYEAAEPKWISIDEEFPKEGNQYLFYSGGLTIILFHQERGLFFYGENRWCSPITHWLPLPNPPKQ